MKNGFLTGGCDRQPTRIILALCFVCVLALWHGPATAEEFRPSCIPVVYLHIDGGQSEVDKMNESDDHSYNCTGTMDLQVPEGYEGQSSLTGLKLEYIRGRGNTTWRADKKPYKIKFAKKQNFHGFGANKHWVLLANYYDGSLLRNRLTMWLGEQLGLDYTPQGFPVDVVMNGDYIGSYYLFEQVRIGSGRIEIDELTADDKDTPVIYGGYLLGVYSDLDEDTLEADVFTTAHDVALVNDTPSFAVEDEGYDNPQQMNYIRGYVQRTDDAIFAEDGKNADGEHYSDLIDVQSVVDYWLIQEVSANQDGMGTPSSYLYKPRFDDQGNEGMLYFGPLWDFDLAWGNHMYQREVDVTGFNHALFGWLDELRQRPGFASKLKQRWKDIDRLLDQVTRSGGLLDQWKDELDTSWNQDHAMYGTYDPDWEISDEPLNRTFWEEIERLRSWIDGRRDWINANLDLISKVFCTITTQGEGIETNVLSFYREANVDTEYYLGKPEREGYAFDGWFDEDGEPAPEYLTLLKDMVYTARFSRLAPADPTDYDDVAVPSDTFTFKKVWQGGAGDDIDFTLYRQGGSVYRHGFNRKTVSRTEWQYDAWFESPIACYVIEAPVAGYQTRYVNVGVYADVTDRCCNGGTIVNYRVPKTGDESQPVLWLLCILAGGLMVLLACGKARHRG